MDFRLPVASRLLRSRWLALAVYFAIFIALVSYFLFWPEGLWNTSATIIALIAFAVVLALQAYFPISIAMYRNSSYSDASTAGPPTIFLFLGALGSGCILAIGSLIWVRSQASEPRTLAENASAFLWVFIPASLFFASQALFLSGAPQLRPLEAGRRRPLWLSLAAGTFLITVLCVGVVLTQISLYALLSAPGGSRGPDLGWAGFFLLFAGCWACWFLFFAVLWRGARWSDTFPWLYRFVFGGTCLELLVTIRVDAYARKKHNCYCESPTLLAMILGIFASLWLFGPGVLLLFLIRRTQRGSASGYCRNCGAVVATGAGRYCQECRVHSS